jgi:propionyl-CoA carboxylase beta chain
MDDTPAALTRRIEAQHAAGKLTAGERAELLFDQGSFHQSGTAGGDGVVTGWGTVSGRPLFLFAKDATVFGGSLSATHADSIAGLYDMALTAQAPVVGLFDGGGVRFEDGVAALAGYGRVFRRSARAAGTIPQIALVMGPCVGIDAVAAAMADVLFMVEGSGRLFVGGPDLVRAVTNEVIAAEDLGGASVHTGRSYLAHGSFADDVEALLSVRRLVDFLPANSAAGVPVRPCGDDVGREAAALDTLVPDDPESPYDARQAILAIVDDGDFCEIGAAFAGNLLTGFGRIGGATVALVANQPMVMAGVIDGDAARKAARFVRFCDAFGIPLVTLVDVPGFLPGSGQEWSGLAGHAAHLACAYAACRVPLIGVVLRHAYGGAYLAMGSKPLGADLCLAWPSADIGLLGRRGAGAFADGRDGNPGTAARPECVDQIIPPRLTRRSLAVALALLSGKTALRPAGRHVTFAV